MQSKMLKNLFINEGQSFVYVLIIILFHLQMMYILYSLTSLSAVLQEVVSVTVSTIQYSNAYHSIQYYYTIALILIIIISICSQTHKYYYNAKHFHLFSFHVKSIQMRMRN